MLKKINPYVLQSGLFILTVISTTYVGAMWIGYEVKGESWWDYFLRGLPYSISFLGILTIHEFGHYITARIYKVDVTLPYYLPIFIPLMGLPQLGTLGAFIRMNSRSASKKEIFDIGIAGPLAGFVAAMALLFYGFTNLPDNSYLFKIHPDYEVYGNTYADSVFTEKFQKKLLYREIQKIEDSAARGYYMQKLQEPIEELAVGKNLIFMFFENYVVQDKSRIPHKYEMYHYPFILAGYLALFFTALNLIPVGQLDGGHVIYGLFGYHRHRIISRIIFVLMIYLGGVGVFRTNIFGINFFNGQLLDIILFGAIYLHLLYLMLIKTFKDLKNTLMVAVVIFASQFFTEYLFPDFKGLGGYIFVFCILIGRFMGTDHPPAMIEEPLDWKRKLLGWMALVIFVISFIPEVFVQEYLK